MDLCYCTVAVPAVSVELMAFYICILITVCMATRYITGHIVSVFTLIAMSVCVAEFPLQV